MKRNEWVVASAILTLVLYTLVLSVAGQVLSSVQSSRTVSNVGSVQVQTVGVGVYGDSGCTNPLSSIDWGVLEPGLSKDVTCYIRNEGDSASTLSMYVSNWDPPAAATYISVTWDYGGQSVDPGGVVQVVFTLSVSAGIQGITSFSFDITIAASS